MRIRWQLCGNTISTNAEISMRFRLVGLLLTGVLFALAPVLFAQGPEKSVDVPDSDKTFDPHDLSGVWRLSEVPKSSIPFISSEPEPPLTAWGKQHLFPEGITHASKDKDITVSGGFAGQNCDPIGFPAQFAYLQFYPLENIQLPGRIHQAFELHREFRDIWIGEEHPKGNDLLPTYMGDSVGKWDGDTLVVDTIGYNGKDWITEYVDHPMSDQFHLIERYRRTSYNTIKVEMTFYDAKFWGDKPWAGFTRVLKLQNDRFQEWICVPDVDAEYNQEVMKPAYGSKKLNVPKAAPKK